MNDINWTQVHIEQSSESNSLRLTLSGHVKGKGYGTTQSFPLTWELIQQLHRDIVQLKLARLTTADCTL